MLKKVVGKIWKKFPYALRFRIVRASQVKFTTSVVAIVTDDEKVLLLEHVLRPLSSWGLPGGFINAGEQPEAAIRREIFEETGLELENPELLWVRVIQRHVEIMFRAKAVGRAAVKSMEIVSLGWFAIDELPTDFSRMQRKQIENVIGKSAKN